MSQHLNTKAGGVLCCTVVVVGAWATYVYHDSNFHEVVAGELYRSAQMLAANLVSHVHANGIRSVLNLRGEHPEEGWYSSEISASAELGIPHYDLALSADQELTPAQRDKLLQIMADAPKPLLIHCKRGADRTGLASALYLRHAKQMTFSEAGKQLSLWYGHFPWLGSGTVAMEHSFQSAEY